MTKDNLEYAEGGILRDQFGRKEYTLRGLHQARATGDALEGGTIVDADKREQIVLRDINGNTITALNTFTGYAGIYDITASPYNCTVAAANNTVGLNLAITAAKTNGGIVFVPPGVFKYSGQLVCDQNSHGFQILGVGADIGELAEPASELRYTGTGATAAISCHSVFSFSMKNLRLTYDNAAFTGDLVDIDGGPHAADCTNWSIEGCGSRHITSITARSIIRMSQAINGVIRDCGLAGAGNCVRFADSGGPYVVGVGVENCTFNNSSDAHILLGTSGGENNYVSRCRFEAGNNTTAIRGTTIAVDGGASDNAQYSFAVRDSWCGDSGAATTWIKNVISQSNQYPCTISGTRFASTNGGTHLTLKGRWLVETSSFEGGTVYDSIGGDLLNLVAICNYYNTPSALFNATRFAAGYPQNEYVSLGNSGAENVFDARIGIKATGATFGTLGTQPGDFLLGARVNSGYETGDTHAKIYQGKPPALTRPMLCIQAPTDGTDGFITMAAGTTPNEMMRVGKASLSFFGVADATRPAAYTLNAGAVTRNLASGGAVANVEQTLRQLITDLQAYGLLQ